MHTASIGEKKIDMAGNSSGSFIFPKFQAAFDAMFAFAKLMELLAREGRKLSEILHEIPNFNTSRGTVECTWQQKGKIMRRMIETNSERPMEVIEGLKIYYDQSWALMLPDPTNPCFHLFSEAATQEEAQNLIEEFARKIDQLKVEDPARSTGDEVKMLQEKQESHKESEPQQQLYLSVERAFHFWSPGKYLGIRARSFKEFMDAIQFVEPVSLEFHMAKGDFANWLEYELDKARQAERIRSLKEEGLTGENLRERLLEILV